MIEQSKMSAADLKNRARELSHALGRLPESEASESDRRALRRELALVERAMGEVH